SFSCFCKFCLVLVLFCYFTFVSLKCDSFTDGSIYKYHAKTLNGSQTVNFSDYIGKSVLFVNVATY
uniref:Glutathione peroxidase n=1 Tax=Oryzias latipes TaxID=8090 RepID=A0A3P9IYI1_ORYLA